MFVHKALLGLICAGAITSVFGQSREVPPPYRGVRMNVDGVFVTPVPGLPFSAVVQIRTTQVLPDGSSITQKSTARIARDSQGRIYNESRMLIPANSDGTPRLLSAHIYDPQTRQNIFLNAMTHIARESIFRQPAVADSGVPAPAVPAAPSSLQNTTFQQEDLGGEMMEGVLVHGVRQKKTVPIGTGSGKPPALIPVMNETWYSEDLHMNVLVKHDDPRTGTQTVTITEVQRSEPDPAVFQVPADYKIVDVNPPANE